MKKQLLMLFSILTMTFAFLLGCDPTYPPGNIKVDDVDHLSLGETVTLDIEYPNNGGTIVFGWKDHTVEIVSGIGLVSISGLSVTGTQAGVVVIHVSATTVISEYAAESGYEERVYSTEISVNVEAPES